MRDEHDVAQTFRLHSCRQSFPLGPVADEHDADAVDETGCVEQQVEILWHAHVAGVADDQRGVDGELLAEPRSVGSGELSL